MKESFESPTEGKNEKNLLQEVLQRTPFIILVAGGAVATEGMHKIIENHQGKKPIDPKGEFQVMDINETGVTLKQGEVTFTVKDASVSEEVKKKIIDRNPELKSFLDNGPIKVMKPEEQKN